MAEFFEAIDDQHREFIARQPLFVVATATASGRINVSPKGYDVFRVLGPKRVAYLDLGGSGNETHAHLVADGRVTILFNSFENPARIMRIYGKGRPVLPQDDEWGALAAHFTLLPGTRQIFDIEVESLQTSCGYGVPFMELTAARETLIKAHAKVDPDVWVAKYSTRVRSIDGLPTRATDRYFGAGS
ncbi:MAG: pyridoxamine 5'-phosphate oxidase family protein [Planctomycetota bacterium]